MLKIVVGCSDKQWETMRDKLQGWVTALLPNARLCCHCARSGDLLSEVLALGSFSGFLFFLCQDMETQDMSILELSNRLRTLLHNCYFIYSHSEISLLPELVNQNVMPSGFIHPRAPDSDLIQLLSNTYQQYFKEQNRHLQLLTVTIGSTMHNIPYPQILYIESADKLIHVITDRSRISFRDTMSNMEIRLRGDFLRCHASYLLNISKIEKIDMAMDAITLAGGRQFPISRSYQNMVRAYIKQTERLQNRQILRG